MYNDATSITEGTKLPAMSSGPIPLPATEPTVVTMLEAIKFEIDNHRAEVARPGWTIWAMVGGLAAIIWTLLDALAKSQVKGDQFLALIVGLELTCNGVIMLRSALLWPTRLNLGIPRFFLTNQVGGALRFQSLVRSTRSVVLLVIIWHIWNSLPEYIRTFAIFFYCCSIITDIVSIICSFKGIPLPVGGPLPRTGMITAFVSAVATTLVGALILVATTPTVDGYRVAILVVTASMLISAIVGSATISPLLPSLIGLRRELAMGRIEVQAAIKKTDIILLGMRVSEVLQEGLKNILDALDLSARAERSAREAIDNFLKVGENSDQPVSREEFITLQALHDSASQRIKDAKAQFEISVVKYDDLWRRRRWLSFMAPHAGEEIVAVLEQYGAKQKETKSSLEDWLKRLPRVEQVVSRLRIKPDESGDSTPDNKIGISDEGDSAPD